MSQTVIIENDNLKVQISTLGAEMRSVQNKDGKEYLWSGDPSIWGSVAPILFPICGGLKENKYTLDGKEYTLEKHGFIRKQEFEIAEKEKDRVLFSFSETEETLASYPYKFRFTAEYILKDNSIITNYSVTNNSGDTMYFSVGAHEGFATPEGIEDYKIVFEKHETLNSYKVDSSLMSNKFETILENSDTLELKKDYFVTDAIILKELNSRSVTLVNKNGDRKIKYDFPDCDHLLLWQICGAKYLCIEPWTGLPDIVGTGYELENKVSITPIESEDTADFTHTITFD